MLEEEGFQNLKRKKDFKESLTILDKWLNIVVKRSEKNDLKLKCYKFKRLITSLTMGREMRPIWLVWRDFGEMVGEKIEIFGVVHWEAIWDF